LYCCMYFYMYHNTRLHMYPRLPCPSSTHMQGPSCQAGRRLTPVTILSGSVVRVWGVLEGVLGRHEAELSKADRTMRYVTFTLTLQTIQRVHRAICIDVRCCSGLAGWLAGCSLSQSRTLAGCDLESSISNGDKCCCAPAITWVPLCATATWCIS
jgi:hypothetical protein